MKSKNLSEKILRSVKSKGFKYIELPSVIEANHIVQRSGENFRKFMFSFTDINGKELCLRPDLTIASCLRYLEEELKGKEKIFYSGQAYRKVQNKKDSIIRNQVGFEIIGSKDEKNDDKEIINTSLVSLQSIKYTSGTLTIGNVEIFNLLISITAYIGTIHIPFEKGGTRFKIGFGFVDYYYIEIASIIVLIDIGLSVLRI